MDDVNELSVHNRLVHLMVCQTLHPRGGNWSTMTKEDVFLMWKIIKGQRPNLGKFIVRKMTNAVEWSKDRKHTQGLPYGKLVSWIITKHCGDLNGLEKKDNLYRLTMEKLSEGWIFTSIRAVTSGKRR